jgi:hypothetical protein
MSANEKRREWGEKVSRIAQKIYRNKDGSVKDKNVTWGEAMRMAREQYDKKNPKKAKSKCSKVVPNEDGDCDEPCPVKYKSRNDNIYCKSKQTTTRSSKPKKTRKIENTYVGYLPDCAIKTKSIKFEEKDDKYYLFDADGNPVEIKDGKVKDLTRTEAEAEYLKETFDKQDLRDIVATLADEEQLAEFKSIKGKTEDKIIKFILDNFYNKKYKNLYLTAVNLKEKEKGLFDISKYKSKKSGESKRSVKSSGESKRSSVKRSGDRKSGETREEYEKRLKRNQKKREYRQKKKEEEEREKRRKKRSTSGSRRRDLEDVDLDEL